MTPLERYKQDLQREDFVYDPTQEMAVGHLQRLYDDLVAVEQKPRKGVLDHLVKVFGGKKEEPVKGLYFWGGVGRGKTYLMDTFFESLPFERKTRTHFHRFMQRVHHELRLLDGTKNPLVAIGRKYAEETRVLCFDEFFVSDITDAMILGGLMEQLFSHGVTLVATSNIIPDELYRDGLQRDRFLPAIDLIKRYTEVVNVDGGVDYRLRTLEQAELYHYPLGEGARHSLEESFQLLCGGGNPANIETDDIVEINGRGIRFHKFCDDIAWFDFDALCNGPRSQNDYIELSKLFHTVIVSDVPQMGRTNDDVARRFINMVDEFYDSSVKLIMSAEVPITDLYTEGRLSFEFQRTQSRLLEMQSKEYLAQEHRSNH